MNSSQISSCLHDIYGTDVMDQWIDMCKVACIYLDQDANLYPDKKHVMFFFDTTDNVLKVKTGRIVTIDGNKQFQFDSDVPNHIVSFDVICGFIQTSKITESGQMEYVV